MDLDKLSRTDRIIAGSGLVLFIASFLPWFDVSASATEFETRSTTGNGWDVGFIWGGIPALLGLLAAGMILATKLGNAKMPELPVPYGQLMLGLGGLSGFLVLLKLLVGEDAPDDPFAFRDIDISRAWGLFVATLAGIAFAAGGWLAFQEEKSGTASGPTF